MSFDTTSYGLLSHYSPETQQRIRRLILEDWSAAGVKLPTYMKLLARYIAPTGVSEDWLAKLSHQTMDKMLKSVSTPRYEFWACLHLYIIKKYGDHVLCLDTVSVRGQLGLSLAQFGGAKEAPEAHGYALGEGRRLDIQEASADYAVAHLVEEVVTQPPFEIEQERVLSGVAIQQNGKILAVVRESFSYKLTALEVGVASS